MKQNLIKVTLTQYRELLKDFIKARELEYQEEFKSDPTHREIPTFIFFDCITKFKDKFQLI